MRPAALPVMLAIQLRVTWRVLLVWILSLAALMLVTTTSISSLYDTQAKIDSYAAAVHGGDALVAINGRVAGIDTLGGVIANEFGFVAAFAIPFLAISLVARMTRRDEEHGRLEALLAGRIGRGAPVVAAVLLATLALVLTAGSLLLGLTVAGIPLLDSLRYAASMAALGFVFAGVAALAAQLVERSRGVYAAGLGALVVAYLLRGIGDVTETWLSWLSPLGWQQATRAFGDDPRWWPLGLPVLAGLGLLATAAARARHRDLGSALLRRGGAPPRASTFLRTPLGVALRLHRGAIVGWTVATVIVAATFGALAQPIIDALAGNESVAEAMGAAGGAGLDAVLTMTSLLLGLLIAAYAVQAVGVVRGEETSGRLESRLSAARQRWSWLGVHVTVVLVGLLVVAAAGGAALVLAVTWSTGAAMPGQVVRAVGSYLPAALVLAALALLLFGLVPRAQPAVWLGYGVAAVLAYLGEPLELPRPLVAVSPFDHVGRPPQEPVDPVALVVLGVLAVVLATAAFVGFRRRGIPRG